MPAQLSGGQQQRVALARAHRLPTRGAAAGRAAVGARQETARGDAGRDRSTCSASSASRSIFVTHDQTEALTMADRVAVLNSASCSRSARRKRTLRASRDGLRRGLHRRDQFCDATLRGRAPPGQKVSAPSLMAERGEGDGARRIAVRRTREDRASARADPIAAAGRTDAARCEEAIYAGNATTLMSTRRAATLRVRIPAGAGLPEPRRSKRSRCWEAPTHGSSRHHEASLVLPARRPEYSPAASLLLAAPFSRWRRSSSSSLGDAIEGEPVRPEVRRGEYEKVSTRRSISGSWDGRCGSPRWSRPRALWPVRSPGDGARERAEARAAVAAVLLPLWTSVLVRTYAWLVLLQRNGVINQRADRPASSLSRRSACTPKARSCWRCATCCCPSWCCRSIRPCGHPAGLHARRPDAGAGASPWATLRK